MRNKKYFSIIPLFAAILLLAACAAAGKAEQSPEGRTIYSPDGFYWTTDGDCWYPVVTDGNVWYATDGDYYPYYGYTDQMTPYATGGNVDSAALKEVHVSTIDELLSAIAPETAVYIAPGEYRLSDAHPAFYKYCYFRPTYGTEENNNELVLCKLYDCVIASESGKAEDVSILCDPRLAAALTVEDCYGVQLKGISLGHTRGGVCSGAVLRLVNSGSVYVSDCDLYGCGTVGANIENCYGVTLENSVIHDCSDGGVDIYNSSSVKLSSTTFRKAGSNSALWLSNSHWIDVENCRFEDNFCHFFLADFDSERVFFDSCSFGNNAFTYLFDITGYSSPELRRCQVSEEQYLSVYSDPFTYVYAISDGAILR